MSDSQYPFAGIYGGQDILVWDLSGDYDYETYNKYTGLSTSKDSRQNTTVRDIVFSPSPDSTLFAASYFEGNIVLFDTSDGSRKESLQASAQSLAVSPNGRKMASYDSSGVVQVFDFETLKPIFRIESRDWGIKALCFSVSATKFDRNLGFAIEKILNYGVHSRMLVCSQGMDTLYDMEDGRNTILAIRTRTGDAPHRWAALPNKRDLFLIRGHHAHIFTWDRLQCLSGETVVLLDGGESLEGDIEFITPCYNGLIIVTSFSHFCQSYTKRSHLFLFSTSSFETFPLQPRTAKSVPDTHTLSSQVQYLIGPYAKKLVFLHASGWFCSAEQESFAITRHFFVPTDWLSSNLELMIRITISGDILFVRGNEVAVIKRG